MKVFPRFEELHVYRNGDGDVVLKQIQDDGLDDDIVVIPQIHLAAVIRAMREASKDSEDGNA